MRRQVPRRFSRLDVALMPIGGYKPAWFMDVHEMSYIISRLLEDHCLLGDPQSLAAARKGADYLVKNWNADWARRIIARSSRRFATAGSRCPALIACQVLGNCSRPWP